MFRAIHCDKVYRNLMYAIGRSQQYQLAGVACAVLADYKVLTRIYIIT